MKVLAYRGKSWVSKAIQWQTRSPYSHVAIWMDDYSVIEAWHKGGVRRIPDPYHGHTPGTPIDVFRINAKFDAGAVTAFLEEQIGKKYDFKSVGRFITRRDAPLDDAWFCSEMELYAFAFGGCPQLRGNYSQMSPRDSVMSPLKVYEQTL